MKRTFLAIAFFSIFFWQSAFAQLWCSDEQHPFSGYMFVNDGNGQNDSLGSGLGSLIVLRPSVFAFDKKLLFTTGPLGVETPRAEVCVTGKCASESSGDAISGPGQNLVYLEADVTYIKKGAKPEGPELMVVKASDRRYSLSADWHEPVRGWRVLLYKPGGVNVLGVSTSFPLNLNTTRRMRFEVDNKGARLFVSGIRIINIPISILSFYLGQSGDAAAFDSINAAFTGLGVGDRVHFARLRVFAKCGCANDCSFAGERGCVDSNSVRVCGNFDPDACLDWKKAETCSVPKVCVSGECIQPRVSLGVNVGPNPLVAGEQATIGVTVNNSEPNPVDANISLGLFNAVSGEALASSAKIIRIPPSSSATAVFGGSEINTTALVVGTYKAVAKTTIFGNQISETAFFSVVPQLKATTVPELHPVLVVLIVSIALYLVNKK